MIDAARYGGEAGLRERKTRIESDRLLVEPGCALKICQKIIRTSLIFARPQVEHVSVGIVCWLTFDLCLLLRRERGTKRIRNTFRHFGFNTEHVGQLPIIALRPKMGVVLRLNKLDIDVHAVAGLLNTSFEDIGHVQSAPYF